MRIYTGTSAATGTLIAGARTDGMTINTEFIDITDKDDAAIRKYIDGDDASRSWSMSCEGVLKDDTLLVIANTGQGLQDMVFEIDGIGDFNGKFGITSIEVSGAEGSDPATFTASFESGGAVTYVAEV